ncbi:hypothetical protein GH714_008337 [Hevea brasiliensis]|uniref:Uncharacterized protein n=1 Tax=Hevea brasiliensis TaxID=3981 RepID=A0A6A6KKB8_HEVBR|nr:hypothetical protein GH714_008337 [Hevea brasiliensis]
MEEDISTAHLNNQPSGFGQESDSQQKPGKLQALQNPFAHSPPVSASTGLVSHALQVKGEEVEFRSVASTAKDLQFSVEDIEVEPVKTSSNLVNQQNRSVPTLLGKIEEGSLFFSATETPKVNLASYGTSTHILDAKSRH